MRLKVISVDTIFDYIKWRGDERFSYRPFNDVDAVVICYLSYLDMTDGMKLTQKSEDGVFRWYTKPIKLREVCRRIKAKNGGYNILSVNGAVGASPLVDEMSASKRFGDLYISDYMEVFDKDNDIQFSAMTVDLDNHTSFIVFRGTDDSLPGWKEDFMLSYKTIPGQKLAADYAKRHIENDMASERDDLHRYYMGGHSKGGNLVLYAAATLPDDLWLKIEHVYMLDGPGLCKDVMPEVDTDHIAGRTTHIRPEFSVIGGLFDSGIPDTRIVKSDFTRIMQHDPSSWGVKYGELYYTDGYEPFAEWINAGLDKWIENAGMEERERFVTELFDAFAAGGYLHFKDLNFIDRRGIQNIVNKMSEMSPEVKAVAQELPKQLIRALAKR